MSHSRTMKRHIIVSIVFAFFLSVQAQAVIYPFTPVYPTNAGDGAAEAMALQLSLEVVDRGSGMVEFRLYNNLAPGYEVPTGDELPGIATKIAFEDGTLLSIGTLSAITGTVAFTDNPPPPPGTWGLGFDTTHFFRASADSPSSGPGGYGVNEGEGLSIMFSLQGTLGYNDVISALNAGFAGDLSADSLRIGIHVQNYGVDNEFSDAFILTPIPPSVIIGLLGMGIAGIKLRKFA